MIRQEKEIKDEIMYGEREIEDGSLICFPNPNINRDYEISIEGTDGKDKMSKSYDNYIAFNDTPENMYGKVLSIPDELIIKYFNLVTNLSSKEIKDYEFDLNAGKISPRDMKRKLAREIVSIYYDDKSSTYAEQNFDKIFIKKTIPDDIPQIIIDNDTRIIELVKNAKIVDSNSEIRRLIKQGAVKIDDAVVNDINFIINLDKEIIIKIGKRKFLKVIPSK